MDAVTTQFLVLICERHSVFGNTGTWCFRCAEEDGASISATGGAPVTISPGRLADHAIHIPGAKL